MKNAKLIRARFRDANLAETDLTGANLKGANLRDITQNNALFCNTIMLEGFADRSGC